MLKNKAVKLVLFFGMILSVFMVVGCSNSEKPKQQALPKVQETTPIVDETDTPDYSEYIAGPGGVLRQEEFPSFEAFNYYFSKLKMNGYSFVSFDLDKVYKFRNTSYLYATNALSEENNIDKQKYLHDFSYQFSFNDYIEKSDTYDNAFVIKCYDIVLIEKTQNANFEFKLSSEVGKVSIFNVMLNNECIMKIKIELHEDYTLKTVDDIISLLKNNIKMI